MNFEKLQSVLKESHISIPQFAEIVGVKKKAMYQKMRGETEFKRSEIKKAKVALNLSDEKLIDIFFADVVA